MEMEASYTPMNPKKLRTIVNRASKKLKLLQKKLKFDTIVIRGNSGSCVGYPVSVKTGIPIVIVRKDSSHGDPIEGECNMTNYIILDDFIFMGGTVNIIHKKIAAYAKDRQYGDVKCVGIALYANDSGKRKFRISLTKDKWTELPVFDV